METFVTTLYTCRRQVFFDIWESTLPGPDSNGPLYSSQMSPGCMLIWREKATKTVNLILFGLESLWVVTLTSMCSMDELSLLRDIETISSLHMLVSLVKNSSNER
ncbi:hypothetical protein AVEN_4158-1 [Araneus ventricosus]|uniref:Uncharacterized protein n=1 Tax=Araneus ventricosus TaxID=182803 RepID=A0A4Y2M6N3_ARAVE|nr:hypothetical protein AVEN_4158-1 [Araneus ventricosus]